ncbi:hypothetical protein LTR56_012304 [Elasticomyces elasticus]|nr:hypothetical protein LTR56_012304 [Elasticomyces elasticus]KAK3641260.1 hypothetical protein LTR22_016628 [Elasticomyces elasticus]KAK4922589.1 hypothetical protein LTR49_010116 [Elasticomyces elasticus]
MAPRYCHAFQSGACRKGDECSFDHATDPDASTKMCMHAARGDECRMRTCPYSHTPQNGEIQSNATDARSNGTSRPANTEAQFKEWRYAVPPKERITTARPPVGATKVKFCKVALELIGGDIGTMQEVVTLLASEGGCLRVKEIGEQRFDKLNATITNKNVVSSLILAPRLMTVYNILYGESGQRAVSLFAAMAKHIQGLPLTKTEDPNAAEMSTADTLDTVLAAFHKLVEVNTESQVHGGLKAVVESFRQIFAIQLPPTAAFAFKPASKHLRRLEQRFGLGQAIPEAKDHAKVTNERAVFELARERPGELSEDGIRHDNDHVDIRQISILPTLQEIQSARNEYLPLADPREWHLGGLEGLLDRHFRLSREDTVGQLRDAAKFELERLHDPNGQIKKRQGARTFVYRNVAVATLAFDPHDGMEFVLGFDQPREVQGLSASKRRAWWEDSKRLEMEALLCLLSSGGSAAFFVVSPPPSMKPRKDVVTRNIIQPLQKQYDLWTLPDRAFVVAKPVNQADIHLLLDQLLGRYPDQLSLVEFPGVLLPAFKPTLKAMQTMSDTLDVPFADILAPVATAANPSREVDIGPPANAAKPGFQYDLSTVTDHGTKLYLKPAQDVDTMSIELTSMSELDYGQAQAVVSSLSRALALIQGPPGTGKSYTGVQLIMILLANKKAGDLGPIICVCYTNHALDQGLERLVDEGVQKIVRIGGHSKSQRLADVNLRTIAQKLLLTKTERDDRKRLTSEVEKESSEINRLLAQMRELRSEASVAAYLESYYPEVHTQLFGSVDEDGFETVNYHSGGALERWLNVPWGFGRPRPIEDLYDMHIAYLTGQERSMLCTAWVDDMRENLQDRLRTALESYNKLKEQLDSIRTEMDLRVLSQANIIGITTSGLARSLDLIRRTNAKVLVCEEAGEVLESHLLTALLPSVEHAILIGDHQQLRPHIQNYSLSCESKDGAQYALDVSLFERLVQPQDVLAQALPFCTLSVQRRMHPAISKLIRFTLYPQLQDAPSLDRPPVVGMRHRLFWMHHEHEESESVDPAVTASHTNDYEVEMVAALVKHLVHQGEYAAEDIAVITPYLGQLRKVRSKLSSTFNIVLNERDVDDLQKDGNDEQAADDSTAARPQVARGNLLQAIRLATVDNFQEEEAKVIVVSLVRSNAKCNPGFLKTSNRINVLLSRAKDGMYIIGDANTMQQVPMWSEVIRMLEQDGCLGTALELCCPRHEDRPMSVDKPEDFIRLSPEAGCDLPCQDQLNCGHSCVAKCHSALLHDAVFCMKSSRLDVFTCVRSPVVRIVMNSARRWWPPMTSS